MIIPIAASIRSKQRHLPVLTTYASVSSFLTATVVARPYVPPSPPHLLQLLISIPLQPRYLRARTLNLCCQTHIVPPLLRLEQPLSFDFCVTLLLDQRFELFIDLPLTAFGFSEGARLAGVGKALGHLCSWGSDSTQMPAVEARVDSWMLHPVWKSLAFSRW